jgi:hypothetical protein
MARYTTNMGLTAKVEATAGTDAAPAAATDGVLIVKGIDITPVDITYADRNLLQPFFGGSQSLIGTYSAKCKFDVEASGSGTAGTSAVWGTLLQGCATAQASLTTPTRVEHTPVSSGLKTLTIYVYDDGVLHKLIGAVGSAKFSAKQGETPKFSFEFIGTYSAVTAIALPAITLTAWKVPLPVNKTNVVDITLGATYSGGALTGGTVFGSNGIEIDFGNKTSWVATLSSERGELTDRDSKCSFELELTAAQEVTAMSDILSNNLTSIGFTINGTAGNKLLVFAPSLQRTSIKKAEENGVRLLGFEGKLIPSSGNDEWRFVQL